jgi:hypothetical protein
VVHAGEHAHRGVIVDHTFTLTFHCAPRQRGRSFIMPVNMPGVVRRTNDRSQNKRNRQANLVRPSTGISIVSAVKAGSVITITFNQTVFVKGTPNYATDLPGVTALSASMTSPTVMAVTFSAAITTATELRIPYEEKSVRNRDGGFVADSTFPLT